MGFIVSRRGIKVDPTKVKYILYMCHAQKFTPENPNNLYIYIYIN